MGTASIQMASEFETSMAMVSTLFGEVCVSVDNLNNSMLSLSGASGYTATELNDSLYNALSAGIPVTEDMSEAISFMEKSTYLAIGAGAELGDVVDAQTSILNAYKMEVEELDAVQTILIQTQNQGKTTVAELSASLSNVTPTAAALNFSFEQVGASLATITAQGTPTAQATTQLNALLAELGKQGTTAALSFQTASEGTAFAGKSFSDLMNEGIPLNEILDVMSDYANNTDQSMLDLFSSIDAGKAALSVSGANSQTFAENLEAMGTSADVVGSAYSTMSNTFEKQSAQAIQTIKNLGIALVIEQDGMLSEMGSFANQLAGTLSDGFSEGGIDGLVNALGDVLSQIVIKATEIAPKMITASISLIKSLVEGITSNVDIIGTATTEIITNLINGLMEIIPEILVLGYDILYSFATAMIDNLPLLIDTAAELLHNFINHFVDNVGDIVELAITLIVTLAEGIIDALPALIEQVPLIIMAIVTTLLDNVPTIIEVSFSLILTLANGLISALPQLIPYIPLIIEQIVKCLIDNLPLIILTAIEIIFALSSGLIEAMPNIVMAVVEIISTIISLLTDVNWASLGSDIVSGIIKGLQSMGSALYSAMRSLASSAFDSVKDFFGIQSPSTLMRDEVGKMLGAGIEVGIEESTPSLISAAQKQSLDVADTYTDLLQATEYAKAVSTVVATPQLSSVSTKSVTETTNTINNNTETTVKIVADPTNIFDIVVEESNRRGVKV